MDVDWVIVGAGLTGATLAERIATVRKESVLIVEQRNHIAGNAYDEYDEHGLLIHKYGPHIFHTNSTAVWNYLSRFTDWRPYFHKVLASVDGQLINLPFNLNSIEQLFPFALASQFSEKLLSNFSFGSRIPVLTLRESEDTDLRFLSEFIYQRIFESYTTKQWGMKPEHLSPSVTARVPVLVSRDDRYFQDTYQAMPRNGYTAMVRKMLEQPNIQLLLNANWKQVSDQINYNRLIYTGAIDEYFGYKYGPLPYRSLRFERIIHHIERAQLTGTVNYPNEYDFTRVTEVKHLTGQISPSTVLLYEYPEPYRQGDNTPYYPIPTTTNREHYIEYAKEAKSLEGRVWFAGRLADYMYYNMDQAVASALKVFKTIQMA
jgi:UDP-galactopyranose mutase